MDVTVRPVTPEIFSALEELFAQAGAPRWCWCMHFRTVGRDGSRATRDRNHERLRGSLGNAVAPGLLAMHGDEAVGWASLGPREDYPRLRHSTLFAPVDDTPVWSLVCFAVARHARGEGVMNDLLHGGIDYARRQGATVLEAYSQDTSDGRVSSAYSYAGVRRTYERAGFAVVATRRATPSSKRWFVLRLNLCG